MESETEKSEYETNNFIKEEQVSEDDVISFPEEATPKVHPGRRYRRKRASRKDSSSLVPASSEITVKDEVTDTGIEIKVDTEYNGIETGTYYEYILRDVDNSDLYLGTVSTGKVCVIWDRHVDNNGETFYTSVYHPGRKLTFVKRIKYKGLHHLEAAYNAEIYSEVRKKVAELRKMTLVNKLSRTWAVKCLPNNVQIMLSRLVRRLAAEANVPLEDIDFLFKFKVSILLFKTEPQSSPSDTQDEFLDGILDGDENEVSIFDEDAQGESQNDGEEIIIESIFAGLKKNSYYEYILRDVNTNELYCGTVSHRDVCKMWDIQEKDGEIIYTSQYHPGRQMKKFERIVHEGIHHLEALFNAEIMSEARKACASIRGITIVNKNIRNWASCCLPSSIQETLFAIILKSADSATALHLLEFPLRFIVQIQLFKLETEELNKNVMYEEGTLWVKNNSKMMKCYFCNNYYTSSHYYVHLRTHTKEKPFICTHPGCDKDFVSNRDLTLHLQRHSNIKAFKCSHPGCDKDFFTEADLTTHFKRHVTNKAFKCSHPGCDKDFYTNHELTRHLTRHVTNKAFKCSHPGCKQSFYTNRELTRHFTRHVTNKTFKCSHPGCKQSFYTNHELTRHFTRHVGNKTIKCSHPGCDKSFFLTNELTSHLLTHSSSKNCKCSHPGCDKVFFTNNKLNEHLKRHNINRNFKCSHPGCEKAYSTNNALNKHLKRHNINRNFACSHPGCKQSFFTKYELTSHLLTHTTRIRNCKCSHPGCDKAFFTNSKLNEHLQRHSNIRAFKCSHPGCDKDFFTKYELTTHFSRHVPNKTFKCSHPGCDKDFFTKSEVTNHFKRHSAKNKTFKCSHPGCDKAFYTNSVLTSHFKRHFKSKK